MMKKGLADGQPSIFTVRKRGAKKICFFVTDKCINSKKQDNLQNDVD